ncbi:MAG: hypothetical protein HGA25_10210, partial [Clostridiales bacterium]|nr:hypothetical protein [Clostridiales bacterium]
MSTEDRTHGMEKKHDSKDAISKLNNLIAMRFDENTASNNTVSDNTSLKSIVEEVIVSPEKAITEKSMSTVTVNKDVMSSETNDIS